VAKRKKTNKSQAKRVGPARKSNDAKKPAPQIVARRDAPSPFGGYFDIKTDDR
jgi:hypothetical protein